MKQLIVCLLTIFAFFTLHALEVTTLAKQEFKVKHKVTDLLGDWVSTEKVCPQSKTVSITKAKDKKGEFFAIQTSSKKKIIARKGLASENKYIGKDLREGNPLFSNSTAQIHDNKIVVSLHWRQHPDDKRDFWASGGVGVYSINKDGRLSWLRMAASYSASGIGAWQSECVYERKKK